MHFLAKFQSRRKNLNYFGKIICHDIKVFFLALYNKLHFISAIFTNLSLYMSYEVMRFNLIYMFFFCKKFHKRKNILYIFIGIFYLLTKRYVLPSVIFLFFFTTSIFRFKSNEIMSSGNFYPFTFVPKKNK